MLAGGPFVSSLLAILYDIIFFYILRLGQPGIPFMNSYSLRNTPLKNGQKSTFFAGFWPVLTQN